MRTHQQSSSAFSVTAAFLLFQLLLYIDIAIPLPVSDIPNKLGAQLDGLEKHIEQINASISAFLKQQQLNGSENGPSDDGLRGREEASLRVDKAELERLGRDRDELVKRMESLDGQQETKAKAEENQAKKSKNETEISDGSANANSTGNETKTAVTASKSPLSPDATRLLCQFFVFGILFGIVCSISACSCFFRSRQQNAVAAAAFAGGRRHRSNAGELATLNRLSQIREPFAPDKPFCLKFDERGLCYASPLTREVPPLPNYEQACRMPTASELLTLQREESQKKLQQQQQQGGTPQQPQPVLELRI